MKQIVLGPGESPALDGHPARVKASSEDRIGEIASRHDIETVGAH